MTTKLLYVAAFGLVGIFARLGCAEAAARWTPSGPWTAALTTLAINVVGSFMIGVVYALAETRGLVSPELRVALMVGLLGGFTTFSSFTLDVARAMQNGSALSALLLLVGGPLAGLAATLMGMALARLSIT